MYIYILWVFNKKAIVVHYITLCFLIVSNPQMAAIYLVLLKKKYIYIILKIKLFVNQTRLPTRLLSKQYTIYIFILSFILFILYYYLYYRKQYVAIIINNKLIYNNLYIANISNNLFQAKDN